MIAAGADRYLRKAKELIQSSRLTTAFPGEAGKERIITAYLNEIFYGHDAYGIAAAARIYFGVTDLSKLTPAQAALAGRPAEVAVDLRPLPLRRERQERASSSSRPTAPPVVRRDYILQNLVDARAGRRLTPPQLEAALAEPVVLRRRPAARRSRRRTSRGRSAASSSAILGRRRVVETGGYTVITTLDWKAQQLAEKWLAAAAIAPNLQARSRRRAAARA